VELLEEVEELVVAPLRPGELVQVVEDQHVGPAVAGAPGVEPAR
jgi:hypothetical protein